MLRTAVTKNLQCRNVEWSGILNKMSGDAAKSSVGRLRQLYDGIAADNAALPSEVPAINFDGYKAKIQAAGIVSKFESNYNSFEAPTLNADVAESMAASSAQFETVAAQAAELVASSTTRVAELEAVIEAMKNNRTSVDTTVEDVVAMYPEMGEEVEKEIGEMDWKKGI